ncbi:MAG: putative porin, partial [Bacteroidota bacterium]
NLKPVLTTQARFEFSVLSEKLFFNSQVRAINNLIWFSTPEVPLQLPSATLITANTLGSKLKYRSFRFETKLTYQYTNTASVISLPPMHLQSLLFYDAVLFSGNLHLQTGFQLNYYSSFQSNAYMPSLNSYYTQDRREVGNYPFVDFFINAEIKPVRFFVLVDHMNQGLSGPNYLLTPNYPMADRSIKFGFTWLFWD